MAFTQSDAPLPTRWVLPRHPTRKSHERTRKATLFEPCCVFVTLRFADCGGFDPCCFLVSFREIFVSRRLAGNRRLKRRASSSAKAAAGIDRQLSANSSPMTADFKPKLEARHFSRVSDSARRRALVYRAKRPLAAPASDSESRESSRISAKVLTQRHRDTENEAPSDQRSR